MHSILMIHSGELSWCVFVAILTSSFISYRVKYIVTLMDIVAFYLKKNFGYCLHFNVKCLSQIYLLQDKELSNSVLASRLFH